MGRQQANCRQVSHLSADIWYLVVHKIPTCFRCASTRTTHTKSKDICIRVYVSSVYITVSPWGGVVNFFAWFPTPRNRANFHGCVESSRVFWVEYWKRYSSFEYFESSMESCTQALSILSRVWKVVLKLWVCWVEYGKSYSILDSSLSICPIPYSYSRRVWKVVLNLWVFWVEYGKLYSSFEYFESSMGSCTQALSILSRVWKVILDTRLIVEYLPDTVLILE